MGNQDRQTAIIITITSIRTNTLTHRTDTDQNRTDRDPHRSDTNQSRTDRDPDRTDTRLKIIERWRRSSAWLTAHD